MYKRQVIRLDENGAVANFVMNDKCAAGTGRFLEMMARTMEMSLDDMGKAGLSYKEDITISSMCTVFAESEVVSLIAQNKATDDIVHGPVSYTHLDVYKRQESRSEAF